jgi:hypothetical protein
MEEQERQNLEFLQHRIFAIMVRRRCDHGSLSEDITKGAEVLELSLLGYNSRL